MTATLDIQELQQRVKTIYEEVARHPDRPFHFETGRELPGKWGVRSVTMLAHRAEDSQ